MFVAKGNIYRNVSEAQAKLLMRMGYKPVESLKKRGTKCTAENTKS